MERSWWLPVSTKKFGVLQRGKPEFILCFFLASVIAGQPLPLGPHTSIPLRLLDRVSSRYQLLPELSLPRSPEAALTSVMHREVRESDHSLPGHLAKFLSLHVLACRLRVKTGSPVYAEI